MLMNLTEARLINQAHGSAVIAAWEVDDLPEDWIYTMRESDRGIEKLQVDMRAIEKIKAALRAAHPTYGKARAH